MAEEEITEEQAEKLLRSFSENKESIPSFFSKVVLAKDTTKTGNLNSEELGTSVLPVRTYKELAVFCDEIGDATGFSDYFNKMAEIQTSTSLSKDALLLRLVVTSKKEVADVTPQRKINKSWFKKEKEPQPIS